MRITKGQAARRRLQELNKLHLKSHVELHRDFNRAFDAVMRKHGLSVTGLMDVHSFPVEFHEDPELVAAKEALKMGQQLAAEARHSAVSRLPSGNVQIMRAARFQ